MGIPILTVGARIKYAFEAAGQEGKRPTSGYTTIFDITEAPDVEKSVSTIDVSPIDVDVSEYAEGRQDPGGEKTFNFNHTEDALSAWETLCALAEVYEEDDRRCWFEYRYPSKNARSYFFCGKPKPFGNSGIQGNAASQLAGHVVFKEDGGWEEHSTEITAASSTATVVKAATTTVTITNAVGSVKVKSSNPKAATASYSAGTLTITGVEVGSAVITLEDGNKDKCKVVVTVTAS